MEQHVVCGKPRRGGRDRGSRMETLPAGHRVPTGADAGKRPGPASGALGALLAPSAPARCAAAAALQSPHACNRKPAKRAAAGGAHPRRPGGGGAPRASPTWRCTARTAGPRCSGSSTPTGGRPPGGAGRGAGTGLSLFAMRAAGATRGRQWGWGLGVGLAAGIGARCLPTTELEPVKAALGAAAHCLPARPGKEARAGAPSPPGSPLGTGPRACRSRRRAPCGSR